MGTEWGQGQLSTRLNGDGDGCFGSGVGMGMLLKLVAGIRVGMEVVGIVGDGYKYLPPFSSLVTVFFPAWINANYRHPPHQGLHNKTGLDCGDWSWIHTTHVAGHIKRCWDDGTNEETA